MSREDQTAPEIDTAAVAVPDTAFVQQFTRTQRRLFLYILSQVAQPIDAEEILQEANIVIWQKAARFRPESNFFAWARRIADFEIMKFRDRHRRDRLQFSQEFVQQIASDVGTDVERDDSRRRALMKCLDALAAQDRELIRLRYAPGQSGKGVADHLGRPVNSVYQSLGRIRRTLLECVRRRLTAEAGL